MFCQNSEHTDTKTTGMRQMQVLQSVQKCLQVLVYRSKRYLSVLITQRFGFRLWLRCFTGFCYQLLAYRAWTWREQIHLSVRNAEYFLGDINCVAKKLFFCVADTTKALLRGTERRFCCTVVRSDAISFPASAPSPQY